MNILLISPWFPWPPFGGALIRVHQTVQHLSKRHRVTLLAPLTYDLNPDDLAPLAGCCERVVTVRVSESRAAVLRRLAAGLFRGMPFIQSLHHTRAMARAVRQLTTEDAFDIIQVEHSFMAPYLAHASRECRARRVLSLHNVESLRFRRELETMGWSARRIALRADGVLFGAWEKQAVRQFHGIATVSNQEHQWARKYAPNAHVTIVPNGVDSAYFSPSAPPSSPRTIVFTGLLNYPPNADAVIWFCDHVLPIIVAKHPDVRFLIVGDKPVSEVVALGRRPHVQVTGRVPDVRPYLAQCAAVVVPLLSGAGTRLKILEALAMRRPVVSTSLGAEGLKTTDGVNILIGDGPEQFARHVCTLLDRVELGAELGRAGRALVEDTYDWSACFKNLDALYDAVISRADSRTLQQVPEWVS